MQASAQGLSIKAFSASTQVIVDVVGHYSRQIYGSFDWAGTLIQGSGRLTGVSHASKGVYRLEADRDLTGCSAVAAAQVAGRIATSDIVGRYVYVGLVLYAGNYTDSDFIVQVAC